MKKQAIIYIPGLNDHRFPNKILVNFLPKIWKHFGFYVYILHPKWNKGSFQDKLEHIINKIDHFYEKGYDVYLFGQSAGGAAVLNAFVQRKEKIKRVVNICGRLKKGNHVFPSLALAAKGNCAFEESVLQFEQENAKKLTPADKKRILIIKPLFDEIVPQSTIVLKNTKIVTLPIIGHSLGGLAALTVFSNRIRSFLH